MVGSAHCSGHVHRSADRTPPRRPPLWHPPMALSTAEQAIVGRILRATRFVFLRRVRQEWCADAFQAAWAGRVEPEGGFGSGLGRSGGAATGAGAGLECPGGRGALAGGTAPEAGTVPAVRASLEAARQVQAQDVERAALDAVTWRRGVAPERRLSIADAALRHGRKSRRQRVDEDKRHGLRDLDPGLVRAVGVPPAGPDPGSLPSPFV
jgi:hypothetical protein